MRVFAWTNEAYVWQRNWNPQVVAAVAETQPLLDGIQILAAEVSWQNGKPQVLRIRTDVETLTALDTRLTYVIRIAPHGGPFAQKGEPVETLIALTEDLLREAEAGGVNVAEIQIDFDCAESKLDGYRQWLLAIGSSLRQSHPDVRLSFTSLPAWLKHKRAFRRLAQTADSFVLQVHSLEKPTGYGQPITLCDPQRSLQWVKEASSMGKPFLVALPTYGYEVIFNELGRFTALVAEGERPQWQAGTQVQVVQSDPVQIAQLARDIAASNPKNGTGIVWFRLPVQGDRLNWHMQTLKVVLNGGLPAASLKTNVDWDAAGDLLGRIFLENTGDVSLPFPSAVSLEWEAAANVFPVGWDSSGLFTMSLHASGSRAQITSEAFSPSASIAPGQRIQLGWIRFNKPVSVTTRHHDL